MKACQHTNEENLIARIRELAYFNYLSGIHPGDPVTDWLQAEQVVKATYRYLYHIPRSQDRD